MRISQILPDARVYRSRESRPEKFRRAQPVGLGAIVNAGIEVQDIFVDSRDARLARIFRVVPGEDRERDLGVLVALLDPSL